MADKPSKRGPASASLAKTPAKAAAKTSAKTPAKKAPAFTQWSKKFLAKLAETSNITAAAKHAGVATSTVYESRRKNPDFNRAWQQALCEGYDHLEMELLCRLRTGEIKRASTAKVGVRTFENAVALRQLAAHKDSVARQRAVRDIESAAEAAASINAKLDQMRARALAAGEDVWAVDGDDAQA